jgi:hypothetical protein
VAAGAGPERRITYKDDDHDAALNSSALYIHRNLREGGKSGQPREPRDAVRLLRSAREPHSVLISAGMAWYRLTGYRKFLLSSSPTPQLPGFKQIFCFLQRQIVFLHLPRNVRRADEGEPLVRLFDLEQESLREVTLRFSRSSGVSCISAVPRKRVLQS